MKCIVCGKELVQLEPTDIEPAKGMWDGAGVDDFLVGYGSHHDMEMFTIGICDDCIDLKIKEGVI